VENGITFGLEDYQWDAFGRKLKLKAAKVKPLKRKSIN
jgi:hypothetical protein